MQSLKELDGVNEERHQSGGWRVGEPGWVVGDRPTWQSRAVFRIEHSRRRRLQNYPPSRTSAIYKPLERVVFIIWCNILTIYTHRKSTSIVQFIYKSTLLRYSKFSEATSGKSIASYFWKRITDGWAQ